MSQQENKRKNIIDIFFPSEMQKALMNSAITGNNSELYVEQSHLRVKGNFQINIFEKAWKMLIERHDSLRSAFLWEKLKDIHQVVLKEIPFNADIRDVDAKTESERTQLIAEFMEEDAKKGFDFSVPPLMRLTVFTSAEDSYDIVMTIHHVIIDGWAIQILTKEFIEIYTALANNQPLNLNKPVSYKNYLNWHNSQDLSKDNRFWQDKLANLEQISRFPLSMKSDEPQSDIRFRQTSMFLGDELSAKITKFCSGNGITENSFVSASWAILLHVFCSIEKVTFGSVVSQRSHDLERSNEIVGPLINIVPVVVAIDRQLTLIDYLRYVQKELMQSYQHSSLPITKILRNVPARDSKNAIDQKFFDTIVSVEKYFHENNQDEGNLLGLEFKFFEHPTRVDFPVVFKCNLNKIELICFSDYIAEGYAHTIVGLFANLIDAIATDSCRTLNELLGTLSGYYPILKGEDASTDLNLNQQIHENARLYPLQHAIADELTTYTYEHLSQKIKQIAANLDICKGEIVGVYLDRSIDSFLAMLAIMERGGCYLPLDLSYPVERLKFIARDARLARVITTSVTERVFDNVQYILMEDIADTYSQDKPQSQLPEPDDESLAYIIYTSGSTGNPKGAMNTNRGVKTLLASCRKVMGEKLKFKRAMQFSSISFDASILELALSVVSCSCLYLIPNSKRQDLNQITSYLNASKIQFAFLPPIVISHLKISELAHVDTLLTGGDICPVNFAMEWVKDTSKSFYNLYGPTETAVMATYNPVHETRNAASLGYPLPATEIKIIDLQGKPLPPGVVGEILITGPGVGSGYLNNPELTQKSFKYGGYCTGDLAYYDDDGMLYFMGRNDGQVQIRGFRVELGEIESIICKEFKCQEVIIVAHSVLNNTTLHLFMLASDAAHIKFSDVKDTLRRVLPVYMIPNELHIVDEWAVTPNQKIDRKALKEAYVLNADSTRHMESGEITEQAHSLIAEIGETLALDPASIALTDDFFEIGGNSLSLTTLVLRLSKRFNIDLPFQTVYDNSRINDLAKIIEQIINSHSIEKHTEDSVKNDYTLDDSITIKGLKPVAKGREPNKILLTGATGFVGTYFIRELIDQTSADIVCLVRGEDPTLATNRIVSMLTHYQMYRTSDLERLVVVLGDFSKINLGMNEKLYKELAQEIDTVIHCGANVNLANVYSRMSADNVSGTLNIIKFATCEKLKPIHHISTVSVLAGIIGKEDVAYEDTMTSEEVLPENGYIRSKWVAEKIMDNARRKGVPVNIYRLPRVWGDTVTGNLNPNDSLLLMLAASIEIKKFPLLPDAFLSYIIPVDYCVKVVSELARYIKDNGRNYHILYPQHISMNEIVNQLKRKGVVVEKVPMQDWLDTLKVTAAKVHSSKAVKSAASFSLGFMHDILKMKVTRLDNSHVTEEINTDVANLQTGVFNNYINFLVNYSR
ncbi:amino acid adenylation domain-containing protein [Brenneria goodwinii]|uniref:non-ribosomal peptide synthetase family protein n=1 Tax=Brenneria goodwinii TaxID=1109412 RepID=UPI000EF23932|nr:thioester reductase domain-containing protein [Brenneria goodwinii]MCG8157285.1 amino acid adenylation domain-containing protein [Brenneria goodwinii]MCG8162239.1 amino acid adenylation domain-containing protein [Brenneria goodwinii]MCG8166169.1 amino acid adenylation domain-containing protein [Brenneria goodwinii]MCG8170796.1 amino acid adenylation domain-containing protein [Brenneria goodwinii]MCG8175866.1 amino acid adenylation domain-containing protein [Brenneria goodwinii]